MAPTAKLPVCVLVSVNTDAGMVVAALLQLVVVVSHVALGADVGLPVPAGLVAA